MSYKKALLTLSTVLNTYSVAVATAIDVAWINTAYEPDPNTEYLVEHFLPNTSDERSLADGDRIKGIYQITIVTPVNTGTALLDTLQDEITALYNYKTIINTTVGYKVSIDKVYPSDIGDASQRAITIEWQAWRS